MSRLKTIFIAGFFLFVFCFTLKIAQHRYGTNHYTGIVLWDTEGYYLYLPAVFIYHGFQGIPTQTFVPGSGEAYIKPWPGTQKIYTKYTCGEALLISPFWLTAHMIAIARPSAYAPDGFSEIYMIFLLLAIAFYLSLGLFLAWIILRRYFSDTVVILGVLCIWIGTSFIQYTAFNPGNSHVFSFFLISLLVYQTPRIFKRVSAASIFIFGVTLGLVTLVRPTNAIVILYPLLYSIRSKNDLNERLKYLMNAIRYLPLFILGAVLMLVPQFVYWKYITGHWIIFSYVGEGFYNWKNPKIFEVLFDAQNGFFIYAPLMLLSIPGLILGWSDRRLNLPLCLFIIMLAVYTFASWSCWWYGAAYGHRAFIDFLLFFLFPICVSLQRLFDWKAYAKYAGIASVFFLLFLSYRLNSIYQFPWEGPAWSWHSVISKYKEAIYIR